MTRAAHYIRIAGSAAVLVGLATLVGVGLVVARATSVEPLEVLEVRHPAEPTAVAPVMRLPPFAAGESLGQISIERLGLRAEIAEGESDAVLRRGAGHLSDTPWLGQGGNVVLAGHRDTVFRALRNIEVGDRIEIVTVEGAIQYWVEETSVVAPDDLSVLEPFGGSTLTLVTCYPFSFIGSAPNRFIVRARQIWPQ